MTPRRSRAASSAPASTGSAAPKYRTPAPKDNKDNRVEFVREVTNTDGTRQGEFMERDVNGRDVLVHVVQEGAK